LALVERLEREAVDKLASRDGKAGLGRAMPERGKAWKPLLWASTGALVAAAILLGWSGLRRPASVVTAPSHARGAARAEKPAPVAPTSAAKPSEELAILRILSPNARPSASWQARLRGREGEDVRASLADSGRLILRGVGQVLVEENAPSGIVLRLDQGTLLVSFDHDSSRGLAVRTKDALVRVTGTVFAVRVGDGPTQVSVSRGSVEVEARGLPVSVTAGKSWQVGAKRLSALDLEIGQALRELRASESVRTPTSATGGPTGSVQSKQEAVQASEAVAALGPPVAPATEEGDAETLYRVAEKAMGAGHADAAKVQLLRLLDEYPDHALAGPAMYELGRLAFAARNFALAREQFANVRNSSRAGAKRFHEPAAYFICRSDQELGRRAGAISCLERYRAEFPSSPHRGDALAALAILHLAVPDCTSALPLLEEYLNRYPSGSQARAMQTAFDRCKHGAP
jgi:TolA-binding protein